MNYLFIFLCWVVGMVGITDDNHYERIRARGKCREIKVKRHEVVIKFTCQEDAELFAQDLKNFVSE
jgi:hypothetical protein